MPALYVVATPIGNLEDITQRAIRILKEVKLIAAEDTRKTRRLLTAYSIKTPLTSYHEHNRLTKLDYLLDFLEKDDVALVSDAGMPGISDPGYELITALSRKNIQVIPIPGPSALVTAVVISGLPTNRFLYMGFLPHKSSERKKLLKENAGQKATLVFFESPHRINATLKEMLEILGNRRIAVCRELTKIHEEVFRGTLQEAIDHYSEPRGEFTLVVEGNTSVPPEIEQKDIKAQLIQLQKSGLSDREAVRRLTAESGLSRKTVYQTMLSLK
ncbi:MAG TPA: 16S rRNA (cytidine(1402)-2'-O)-methyltransferase [Dehalococcoidales bacterium]|nr:16S rRNA (cytidine(1402)-2'-O)-methyltransferase [Dehalococcoidales bacterium]